MDYTTVARKGVRAHVWQEIESGYAMLELCIKKQTIIPTKDSTNQKKGVI